MKKRLILAVSAAAITLSSLPAHADEDRMPFGGDWSFKLLNAPLVPVLTNPPTFYVIAYGPTNDVSPLDPTVVQILYAHTVTINTVTMQYSVDGNMLITMPNGDTLRAHLEGTANPSAPSSPVLNIDQPGTIIGGTGIFAKARGAFESHGLVNLGITTVNGLAPNTGSVTIAGWITLHDDNRDHEK